MVDSHWEHSQLSSDPTSRIEGRFECPWPHWWQVWVALAHWPQVWVALATLTTVLNGLRYIGDRFYWPSRQYPTSPGVIRFCHPVLRPSIGIYSELDPVVPELAGTFFVSLHCPNTGRSVSYLTWLTKPLKKEPGDNITSTGAAAGNIHMHCKLSELALALVYISFISSSIFTVSSEELNWQSCTFNHIS